MPKTREQKQKIINELEKELKKASSVMFVDYYGLNVPSVEKFREMTKERGCRYIVAKKTLLRIALENTELDEEWVDEIEGGAGLVFGYDSPVVSARIIDDFREEYGKLEPEGGIFKKDYITADKVEALAELPTRKELLSKLVLTINSPMSNFVHVLKGNMNNLVTALSNIKEKKS